MADRFRAFGWHTQEIDGHDVEQIKAAALIAKKTFGAPHAIICRTVKGKGLSYMENNNKWHKGVPTEEQWEITKKELGGE